MMLASLFAVIVLWGGDDSGKDQAELLFSSNANDREQAFDELDRIGLAALPSLRMAAARADAEGSRLAGELIDRIATRRLLHGTSVAVDYRDTSVADVAADLSRRSGLSLVLEQEQDVRFRETKITLEIPTPAPFWEAVDHLCDAGKVQVLSDSAFSLGTRVPRVRLGFRDSVPSPSSLAGPYRLAVTRLRRHRELLQVRPPNTSKIREDFHVDLEIAAEPGILIEGHGLVRLLEAVDERGRDLRAPALPVAASQGLSSRVWTRESLSYYRQSLPLNAPIDRGTKIVRLRGNVPILAVTRIDEIFSTSLEKPEMQTFWTGKATVKLTPVQGAPGTITLEIAPDPAAAREATSLAEGPRQRTLSVVRLAYNPDDHVRIEDREGRPFSITVQPTGPLRPDGRQTYSIAVQPNPAIGSPARLRYYGVAAVATEVPFEFRDLPIP